MAKKLYVGNLSYSVRSEDLNQLFAQYGTVISAEVLQDKFTGRSKGFGFVEMEDDAQADAAIQALNDTDYEGRKMVVNVARPREERPQGGMGGGGFRPRGNDRGGDRGGYGGGYRN
jgi:RNA recognition motif-containing protein